MTPFFLWRTESRRYGLLLVLLTLAAYVPVFLAGFVFDDVETLVKNKALFNSSLGRLLFTRDYFQLTQEASYRPLNTLTFLVDHAIWGFRPFGWHLTNVALHLACVGCLWALFRQWALAPPAAFLGAAAFALHPVHVEVVASPGFREDLTSALGLLAMALFLGRWRSGGRPASLVLALGFAATFLAQMAKENALVAPGLAVALAWADPWPRDSGGRAGLRRAMPFLAVVALATAASACISFTLMVNLSHPSPPPLASTWGGILANAPWIYAEHGLAPVFWPFRLRPDRVVNIAQTPLLKVLCGWVVVALLAGLVILVGRFWRRGSVGFLWHGLAWAPTANLVPLFNPAAERYAYLPDMGLAMILAMGASVLVERIREADPSGRGARRLATDVGTLGVAVLLLFLGGATFRQALIWKDPFRLWSYALELEPTSVNARNGLSYIEWTEGRKALAEGNKQLARFLLQDALRLVREALKAAPCDALALGNYAGMMAEIGDYDRAEADLLRIEKEFPNNAYVNHNLGILYDVRTPPDKQKALQYLQRAKELGFPGDDDKIRALRAEVDGQKAQEGPMDRRSP